MPDAFHSFLGLNKPHSTIRYTAKKLLDLTEQKVDLTGAAEGQGKLLATRLNRLKEVTINLAKLLIWVTSILFVSITVCTLFLTNASQ